MRKLTLLVCIIPSLLSGEPFWEGKSGNQFSARIDLSAKTLSLDEPLTVTATLQFPADYSVDIDSLRINLLKFAGLSEPPFALLSEKEEEIPGGKKVTFTLDPLLDGIHFLSLYDISFTPKEANKASPVEIITDIFEVETTLPKTDQNFRGNVYPLLSLTKRFPITLSSDNRIDFTQNPALQHEENLRNEAILKEKTFPLAQVMGAMLLVILLLIVRMQPKKGPDLERLKKREAISSRKKALKSLRNLKEKGPPPENALGPYFIALSDTVRKYIEESCQIKATTRTTAEFLEAMSKNPSFDETTKELLKDFLSSTDKVKFADYIPTEEEIQSAYRMAKQLVEYAPIVSKYPPDAMK